MNKRVKVMLFTAVPIVVLSLISLFSKQPDLNKGLGIAWLIAGDIWIIAILTGLVFWIRKNREIASGILAGVAIGFASLALTVIIFIALHQTE
jgi:Ca2+/Na+ antiporter